MALVPFGRNRKPAAALHPESGPGSPGRMRKRLTTGTQVEDRKTAHGTDPVAAPGVDGAIRGHDPGHGYRVPGAPDYP